MAEIKLELNENEEKGYYSLLAFSQLSIGEFCYYNQFEHKQGLDVLASLKEKKLVAEVKGLSDRYIPQFPFLNIAEKFKEPAEKFAELKANLQTFFQTKEKEIVNNQQAKIKEVNDAINPKISELQTADTALKTETDKAKSDLEADMKTADESFVSKLAENRSSSKSAVDTKKDALVTQTNTKGSETEQKVLSDSKSLKDSTNGVIKDFFVQTDSSVFNELVKSFDSLKESITALNTELETYENKFSTDSAKWIQDSETKGENTLNTSKEKFSKLISDIKVNISEEQDALQLFNLEFTDFKKFQDSDSSLVKPFVNLRNVLDTSREELNNVKNELDTQITEIIQTDTNNTKETIENSKNVFDEKFSALIDARIQLGESIKTQIANQQSTNISQAEEFVKNQQDLLQQQFDSYIKSITEHAESLKTQLSTFLTDWSTKTKEVTDNWINLENQLHSSEETSLNESNTSLKAELDVLGKKASELRVDLITKTKDQSKSLNESLNTAIKTGSDNLSSSYGELLTSLNTSVDEFNTNSDTMHTEQLTSMKQTYDEVKKSLGELIQTTRSTTDTKLKEQTASVDQTSKTSQETYNNNKNTVLTTMTGNVDQTFTNIDNTNSAYYKGLLDLQTAFVTDMGATIEAFETSLSDLTINQMKGLIGSLQEKFALFTKTQEVIATSLAGFIGTESTVRQSLTQGVDEQAKLLQTNLKDHAGEFEKLAKVGEDLLTPPSSLLDKFNGLVKDYDYPQIESSGIIGWSGSIVQVQNMIKAMKTRVTLLVPNPDDLADLMESITNAKRPKRVDISCQFDMNNKEHVQLIRKLLNQDNITLRNILEKMGTDTKYPPFLAVDRDGEEVMFGTQDPNNKTAFVGMVSQIEPFIQLMGKVVLSDFLSKAKKINQGDF